MVGTTLQRAATRAMAIVFALTSTIALSAAPAASQNPMTFQYGNYCGPGVPLQSAAPGQTADRVMVLEGTWAPADDLDALCFAHDYCFEMIGMDSLICDNAMQAVLSSFSASTPNLSCGGLAENMATAFQFKPWSRGALGMVDGLVRTYENAEQAGGNDLRDAMINLAVSRAAGSCNVAGASSANPQATLSQFVSHVQYSGGVSDFSICTPDNAAAGYCSHVPPSNIPATSVGVPTTPQQLEDLDRTIDGIKGLFGRN